jgi:2-oxoglutarate ferredoxin oxidoreductase subunit alpha
VKKNIEALKKGRKMGDQLQRKLKLKITVEKHPEKEHDLFMTGNDAVSLGSVAGGCNFISSYPMTPGTGVINGIAALSKEFDIVVEQAEDEISAMNMSLGAWYAGARAIVSTSGGGFALMTEAVSLAGIMESPMVIHIAQRPGPATGYPTRTEQGDLNFVLHSGHGEFPRVILAPGTIEDGKCFL